MCMIREWIVSSINGVGKTRQPHAKKKKERERETRLLPHTIHKESTQNVKMD